MVLQVGLIVNPVAGLGGRVGLKGSDGVAIQRQALAFGAVPQATQRTVQALEKITPLCSNLELVTYPGEMGADAARLCGFDPTVIGAIQPGKTTPQDTQQAACQMLERGAGLLLFVGGDGTARDIYIAVAEKTLALGIPAGVKIHSGVFANTPANAGDLVTSWLAGKTGTRTAEVMDVDEQAFRQGQLSTRLFGYLRIPYRKGLVQGAKSASQPGEAATLDAVAGEVVRRMEAGRLYILGPGTTTRAVASRFGLPKTLLGVDVICDGKMLAQDVNERGLLELLEGNLATIVITPIGGQGHILGRGNQQISPAVMRKVENNLLVISAPQKIYALRGQPLLVDTGDRCLDIQLQGYIRVITGYNEEMVYKISS